MKTLAQQSIKKVEEVVEILRKGLETIIKLLSIRYAHLGGAECS